MQQPETTLAPFYAGWRGYNQMLIEGIAALTPEQLMLRSAPNQRPVWLITAHIIGTRVSWFHVRMGVGDQSFAAFDLWDADDAPPRTAADLVAGLGATWQVVEECLASWTPEMLNDPFVRHRGERDDTYTRGWIIWHVLEHDIHHGGELFVALGSHGLPTPDM